MSFRNNFALLASAAVTALYLIGFYAFGHDPVKTVVDSLVIGAAVVISLTWAQSSFRSFFSGMANGANNIIVSIWTIWTVILGYFVYVRVYVTLGRPAELYMSPLGGLFSVAFFLSGIFAVLAPVNTSELVAKPKLIWWFASVAIGSFVAGAIMLAAFWKLVTFE